MSITKRLLTINALICVAFLAILAAVYFSFRNVEDALSGTFATETRRIADNSAMTRDLSRVLSDLELVLRTFYDRNDIVENDGARLVRSMDAILENSKNLQLRGLASDFGKRIEAVLAQCEQVNAIRREIWALEKKFEACAESLDNEVTQGLVQAIVEGSDTSDMEQLSSLAGGYRESFMRVELRFQRLGPEFFKRPVEENSHPLLALLQDLHLRLRTLTASAPKIAGHGQELMGLVRQYEKKVPELHAASAKLESALEKLAVEREALLSSMEESDRRVADKTEETTRALTALIDRTLGLNLLICLLALPLVVSGSVAAFSIKRPVQKVVESVKRLARGDLPGPIEGKYPGEFAGLCADIDQLVETTRRVTRIAEEVADGHVRQTVVERSENDRLIRALNTMIRSLGKLQRETDGMIRAVNQGRLDIRGKAKTFRGGWRDLVLGINQLIAGLSSSVFKTASLEREMALARRIQTSLLPATSKDVHPDLAIAAAMLPAKQVGGDFYDWVPDRSGGLWISIGDVSGHGLTSGLIMMMAQTIHSTVAANLDCDAAAAVARINEVLYLNVRQRLGETHFMTFTALKYLGCGKFQFAGAHLTMLAFRKKTGACEAIATQGTYLNFKPDISKTLKNGEFVLGPGDVLVLYTDGVTEARNERDEMLDLDGFVSIVERHALMETEEMKASIFAEVGAWCGGRRADDMTLVIVKRKEVENA